MKINDILPEINVVSSYIPEKIQRRTILSLCHDSRLANPSCAFFCKVGALTDGHIYAKMAYANGARIFIAEKKLDLPPDAAVIVTSSSSRALERISVMFYGDPASSLRVIGITGTKGKTTVALSIYYIALQNGINAGYIGTNGIYYNGKVFETANTTPDVMELQKTLREMLDNGVTTVVVEVSSQALWQRRTHGIKFETCVFTNLYRDHIGGYEHPTFDHYRDSKKRLFSEYHPKNIIINADSPDSNYMISDTDATNIVTVSAKGNTSCSLYSRDTVRIKNGVIPGISFKCFCKNMDDCSQNGIDVFMSSPGLYSAENGLIILAVCQTLGIDINKAAQDLASLRVPGRFETVLLSSRPNSLFVIDYAHNGASLEAVLGALREYNPSRIICLFGSVGGRTFERRGELARAAKEGADVIIITSDNPNNEPPMSVISDINSAIGETDKLVYLIADRKEAIEKAVEIAQDGDYVLLAGKGHETYQLIKGERIPFSEKRILALADVMFAEV